MRGYLAPFAAALLALPTMAQAAEIVTFAPLAGAASHTIGSTYKEKGLAFAMSTASGFFVWGSGAGANANPGGATLAPAAYGALTIRSAGGTSFDLLRFDVADVMNVGNAGPITYSYETLNGSGFGLFNLDLTPGLQTVSINLAGLKRFTIDATAPGIQLDNVAFALGTSAVPEPGGWALLIGGVGMAGGALRRRRAMRPVRA